MKKAFLIDDGPSSLAPFFSPRMYTNVWVGMLLITAALVLAWPEQAPAAYLIKPRVPPTFFVVVAVTLLVNSYVNLGSGRGEVIDRSPMAAHLYVNIVTWEERFGYFTYMLPVALCQSLLYLSFVSPPLIMAATVSQVPPDRLAFAAGLLFLIGMLCRMVGFLCFLFWGRWDFIGYAVTRMFFLVFFLLTAYFVPYVNPLRILFGPVSGFPAALPWPDHIRTLSLGVMSAALAMLILIDYLVWRRRRIWAGSPPSGQDA